MTEDITPAPINVARDAIAANQQLRARITEQCNAAIEKQICQAYLAPQLGGVKLEELTIRDSKAEIGRMFSPVPGVKNDRSTQIT